MAAGAGKMHADEVRVDPSVIRRLLVEQFPEWAGLPIERVPSTGTVNAIYRVGDDLCVRLPLVERWARDLVRAAEWLPRLAPHLPLAVPEPVAMGDPGEGYPFAWAVYRWLPGRPWTPEGVTDHLAAAADLARFVIALRQVDPSDGPPAGRTPPLAERDGVTRTAIASVRGVVDTEAATEAWEASLRAPAWDGTPVWNHGDLLPANLLVEGGGLAAVIDFGIAGVGDPACDVMAAWSLFSTDAREVYREGLAVDDGTWERGRGWALSVALLIIPYYPKTNPEFAAMATKMVEEILADASSG